MNLNKLLTTTALATFLTVTSFSQTERYSLSIGGAYMFPKQKLRTDFNMLKGFEIGLEKSINTKSSIGINYYSGYGWGEQKQSRELEPKINADGFNVFYTHKIKTKISSKVIPFYSLGIGYEKFKLEKSETGSRLIKRTNGEELNFEIGAKIGINKRKNKELYLSLKKEFFIPNTKTNQNYSNIKFNLGINFKKFSNQNRFSKTLK